MRYCHQSPLGDVMKVMKVSWVTYTGRCVPVSAKGPVINYGEGWGLLPLQKRGDRKSFSHAEGGWAQTVLR